MGRTDDHTVSAMVRADCGAHRSATVKSKSTPSITIQMILITPVPWLYAELCISLFSGTGSVESVTELEDKGTALSARSLLRVGESTRIIRLGTPSHIGAASLILLVVAGCLTLNLHNAYADTFGNSSVGSGLQMGFSNLLMGSKFTLSTTGSVSSISVYLDGSPTGNVKLAIYDDDAANGVPNNLQVQSSSSSVGSVGWATVSVSTTSLTAGNYWLVVIVDNTGSQLRYSSTGNIVAKSMSFTSAFSSSWGGSSGTGKYTGSYSLYATYSTGPPPNDFSISATPPSQSVGAGATASFALNLAAGGGFSGTVNLAVISGSPPGVTPTITPSSVSSFPGSATLSVPTLITTGSGPFNIVVNASCTSPVKSHTVTVTLTVSPPASYSFNVKATATQVVVTLTYSWSGSGSPPSGSITITGPSNNPTLSESGAVVYDRTLIAVSGGTNTYSIIHRATFTITAPGSAQTWTALVSLSGVTNYNVAIEVS